MSQRDVTTNDQNENDFQKRRIKRQRVSRACNFCRHRKIKCDGGAPCLNCHQADVPNCVYAGSTNQNKKAIVPKEKYSLENRLDRVEKLLKELSTQFKLSISQTQLVPGENLNPNNLIMRMDYNLGENRTEKEKESSNIDLERLSGSQFSLCRLSDKFWEWLKKILPEKEHDILIPFENMPILFSESVKLFQDKWIDIPSFSSSKRNQLLQGVFPKDSKFVIDLIQFYYTKDVLSNYVCTLEEVISLFRAYYHNVGHQSRKLKESELLIMNMALVISIRGKLDEVRKLGNEGNNQLFIRELRELSDLCFVNSIFYYRRVLLLNEGIQTLKSIILLLIYTEYNITNSRIDLTLLSLGVRFAEDLGIQRPNTYNNLPQDQITIRKQIWFVLKYFDTEMAYRKGSLPLIQVETPKFPVLVKELNKDSPERLNSFGSYYEPLDFTNEPTLSFFVFTKHLTELRKKSYVQFSNSTFSSSEETISLYNNLRLEMDNLTMLFPVKDKPFANAKEFNKFKLSERLQYYELNDFKIFSLLATHISFYSHLMLLNSIATTKLSSKESNADNVKEYRTISANCARAILEIATQIDFGSIQKSFLNLIIHHIVSAFLSLVFKCITFHHLANTETDFDLLFRVSHNFFKDCPSNELLNYELSNTIFPKEKKYKLICIAALNIAVKVVEVNSSNLLIGHERYTQLFEKLKNMFPSVFVKASDINITRSSISASSLNDHSADSEYSEYLRYEQPSSTSTFSLNYAPYSEQTSYTDKNIHFNSTNNMEDINLWNDMEFQLDNGTDTLRNFFFDSNFGI